ncbi:MAG: S1C family serine protease [Anaerolineales bacterium]
MKHRSLLLLTSGVALIAASACSAIGIPSILNTAPSAGEVVIPNALPVVGSLRDYEATLEQIYELVNPAVVSIQVGQGAGSGFVWDTLGHIVTNNHVVDASDNIQVTFSDGTVRSAELVGADADSDLAVIKVDLPAARLHPVVLASSTEVKVGQLAIAIGNPFALENTMTVGIVSAVGRVLPVESSGSGQVGYTIPDIIQTDAPINPGNSGGVLVDGQGQLIGVTAAIASPVRASAGVGFAIPSDIVKRVVPALIETGRYQHTWLGISGASLTFDLAQAMNLDADQQGALIIDIVPGGPADQADLRGSSQDLTINGQPFRVGGDVITAIGGQSIDNFEDLVAFLARNTEVGQQVALSFLRGGKAQTTTLELAARPSP